MIGEKMTTYESPYELVREPYELSERLRAHLIDKLNLRYAPGYEGDPVLMHASLQSGDDVEKRLHVLKEGADLVFQLSWSGPDPSQIFVGEQQRLVCQALRSFTA